MYLVSPAVPRVALVGDGRLVEADPDGHPAQEARALGHRQQRVQGAPVEQPEVAAVGLEVDLGELVEELVEPLRRGQLEGRLALALLAHRVHDVGSLAPLGDHVGDQLRGVLEVGVDHRHGVPGGVLEARRERGLVAEVARQVDHPHARVPVGDAVEDLGAGVGAAVVDEHQLVLEVGDGRTGAVHELLDELLLVVDGGHHAQQRGGPEWSVGHLGLGRRAVCRTDLMTILGQNPKPRLNLSFIL